MLDVQRRLAAQILNCGENRIKFDPESLEEIKEAITKADLRGLISRGTISKRRLHNTSRFWARSIKKQKGKGKQKGPGSRKGKKTARTPPKATWMNKVRLQRHYLKQLRDKKLLPIESYHDLYMKVKGGFFRSLRHLKLYIEERNIQK